MQTHPEAGEHIVRPIQSMSGVLPAIRHHHERIDGTGYPDHLVGDAIPYCARVMAISDAWDAMTNDRAYRPRLEAADALDRIRAGAGSQWDASLVEIFVQLVESGRVSCLTAA